MCSSSKFRVVRTLVAAVVCLATGASLRALEPRLRITQFAHDAWQERDGLPSSVIQAIAQTRDGYLWLGTPVGLVRFDGLRFTPWPTLPADPQRRESISSLVVGPDGDLWIGTRYSGVRRMRNGRVAPVDLPGVDAVVRQLYFDRQDRLLIGTGLGLYRLEPDGRIVHQDTRESYIGALGSDPQGRLWVGLQTGVELVAADGTRTAFEVKEIGVNAFAFAPTGDNWIGATAGLYRWHPPAEPERFPALGQAVRVLSLYADVKGTLWIGAGHGLMRIVSGASAAANPETLPLKEVSAIFEDREGSLWIGTRDGLHRLKDVNAVPWGETEGVLSDATPSVIAAPDGAVFVMTNVPPGVTEIRDGMVRKRHDAVSDGPSYVAPDGALWIGTSGKLSRLQNGEVTVFGPADGLDRNWISAITADDEEGLLLSHASMVGLRRWNGRALSRYKYRDGTDLTIPFHNMMMLRAHDGTVWVAGFDGLWHLDRGSVTRYVNQEGHDIRKEWYAANPQSREWFRDVVTDGLADYRIAAVAQADDGTLWAASQHGGLSLFRHGRFTSFTTREGLLTNQLSSVLVDDRGDVWMGSPHGILRVERHALEAVAEGRAATFACEVFTRADGLRNNECSDAYQPTAAKSPDGTLWFATKNGVVAIDPARLHRNPLAPPVRIEAVVADGVERRHEARPSLAPDTQKIEFRYTALSLRTPERVRFKYRLVGYDAAWVDAGGARVTQYTRLAPGDYEFRVIACNDDGVWNEHGDTFAFRLQPHVYETLWFMALTGLAVAGGIVGLHRWRVHGLKRREAELQNRVAARTAELSHANAELKREIAERKKVELAVDRAHRELVAASHQAGMAEVATGVLHNVGNALNSVNVSTDVLFQTLGASKLPNLGRVVDLLEQHAHDLPQYLTQDPRGRRVADYLRKLFEATSAEQQAIGRELQDLRKNVEHIREIVAMQQEYARIGGVPEDVRPADLMEDAYRINAAALGRSGVEVQRRYEEPAAAFRCEKHKVLQILVNFIQNAEHACAAADRPDRRLTLGIGGHGDGIRFFVTDNGVGIPDEVRRNLFTYGFTTRKDGHGFGLHTGMIAARDMGGEITVHSDGPGTGATFALILPLRPPGDGAPADSTFRAA